MFCAFLLCQAIFHSRFNAMHLFANSPTVDTIAYKPASPQLVAVSCCACECLTLCFVASLHWMVGLHRLYLHQTV